MMSDSIKVEQKATLGSHTTQIVTQNNYYGLTPQEACNEAIQLFYDNFPRLQADAKALVEKLVRELMDEIAAKLSKEQIVDMSPFGQPDVQYVMLEAQKGYARFGTTESLELLSTLVVERIKQDVGDVCLKITIDKAISIAGQLTSAQMDYLSLLFIVTLVKFNNIQSLEQLNKHLKYLTTVFSAAQNVNFEFLNMFGCFQLDLGSASERLAARYNLNVADVDMICPQMLKDMVGDYRTSPVGTIIAIINAEQKTGYHFDPKIWIHE